VIDRKIEQNMSVLVIRMLRWISILTREDRIGNEYVSGSNSVASIVNKMGENRLRWFRNVMRGEKTNAKRARL